MIYGNTEGIRDSELKKLEMLYDYELEADCFAPRELLEYLAEFTTQIGREISIYISRSGEILDISIGNQNSVELRDIRLRRNGKRLSKVRCIHTHPNGDATLSDVDLSSLRSICFDCMAAVGVQDGTVTGVQASFLTVKDGELVPSITRIYSLSAMPQRAWMDAILQADQETGNFSSLESTEKEFERAVLVGIDSETSLDELEALAETAGAICVGKVLQKKGKPDTATFIGHGKAAELALLAQGREADLVIFDDELSGVQQRNLEQILLGIRVIDRTALILDIFAQRANSLEGKLQVEMAQLTYQLPRLTGHGIALSRLGGGIGTRGPGETQLEMDRRRIRKRLSALRNELNQIGDQRKLRRGKREKNQEKTVALVGYTNAGKTTLLNTLSGENAFAENMLFATLDPLIRSVSYPDGSGHFLLTDTVGFISKLPHALVDAFQSTLEETVLADLLIIVSDGTSLEMGKQYQVVMEVLDSLGAREKPMIHVINKCDLETADLSAYPKAICISAKSGEGTDALLEQIAAKLRDTFQLFQIRLGYDQAKDEAWIHNNFSVTDEVYENNGYLLTVQASREDCERMSHRLGEEVLQLAADSLGM